jgi:hypothetical protein
MSVERITIVLVCFGVLALFAFQLWSVLRTGHVRWRARRIHRAHRPVAFWIEVTACVVGMLVFAGLLAANLAR